MLLVIHPKVEAWIGLICTCKIVFRFFVTSLERRWASIEGTLITSFIPTCVIFHAKGAFSSHCRTQCCLLLCKLKISEGFTVLTNANTHPIKWNWTAECCRSYLLVNLEVWVEICHCFEKKKWVQVPSPEMNTCICVILSVLKYVE